MLQAGVRGLLGSERIAPTPRPSQGLAWRPPPGGRIFPEPYAPSSPPVHVTPERYQRIRAVLARRVTDLTVLMDQVHKPHNLSAIVRSCDAMGLAEAHAVAPHRLAVHRHTASGSGRWVDVVVHEEIQHAVAHLRSRGLRVVAAHRGENSQPLDRVDFTRPTAVLVGSELHGLSEEGRALADQLVEVPMQGMVESFNVSVATAVLLYEAVRQRTNSPDYRPAHLPLEEQERLAFEWSYPRVARSCRANGEAYPPLDEEGYLIPQGKGRPQGKSR